MLHRRQFLATSALAAAATPAFAAPGDANAATDALLSETADLLLTEYPEDASSLGLDKEAKAVLKHRLTDTSQVGRARHAAACAARLKRLRAVDRAGLSGQTAINHAAAVYAHELADDGYRRFDFGEVLPLHMSVSYASTPYVVNPGPCGAFGFVPDFLDTTHTIATAEDAEAYLDRMAAFAPALDGETERLRRESASGVTPPDFTVDVTLKQLLAYRAQPVESWGLVTSLERRTKEKAIAGDWRGRAIALANERISAALDRQIAAVKEARARAVPEPGIWKRRDGDAWYAWAMQVSTTTSISPDEVHRVGLAQNAELDAEMETILRAQGLTQGTVGDRMTALAKDPTQLWPNTDQGRTEIMAHVDALVADIRRRLPQAFSRLPEAEVQVKRVPPEIEAGAPNAYAGAGTLDGSRPGMYYINLRDMGNWPRLSLPSLTLHEALPGHILQGTYQNRLPLIMALLSFNAYSEGWGLYSEQLGDEIGLYEGDPLGRLGYLQSMKFRATRLVVDTGMHAKRWGREQAAQYMIAATGKPEAAVRSEIDRYCVWPGQACGYKIGHNEINRLRERARSALGARFDVRKFNDIVVESGNVPLAVVGEVVDRWVVSQRA